MGRDLAEAFPEARATFEEADAVLGFALSTLAWEGPAEDLTATLNAQPALLTHSIAVLRAAGPAVEGAAMAAGHSLGEFSAHVAAGTLSFPDALRVVRRRGELMFAAGRDRPGAMAALVGLDDEAVEAVCRAATAPGGVCVPANYNAPGQVVVSGDGEAVERALALATEAGARRVVALNVSGAFHSPLMDAAGEGLRSVLETVPFHTPRFPVVSNVDAEPVSDPEVARRLLVAQLTSPVRWTACVRRMREAGVDRFLELGPGSVLAGLLKRIDRGVPVEALGTAADLEAFAVP